jgi:ATP-dependent Clp protease protease subunit
MKRFWKTREGVKDEAYSSGNELIIEGVISDESWWGDEATPKQLRDELQKFKGQPLTVVLNSVGGDVFAGLSMYNALRELDAEVTIRVDGLAASIASVIAMAGDKIIMSPGSMMMVHRPSTIAWGNVEEMQKTIALLETIEESIMPIYAERTGLSLEEVTELVNAETWMSAEKAVELGFADSLAKATKKESGSEAAQNALNVGSFAFSMSATKEAVMSLQKLVDESDEEPGAEAPAEPEKPAEEAPAPAADPAADEADEEDVTDLPEGEKPNPVEEEPTDMTAEEKKAQLEAEAKAKAAADAKSAQDAAAMEGAGPARPKQETPVQIENYLKSRKSIEDFANILVENAGKTAQEVKDAWGQHLVTMGVTNPEELLPQALITEIEDAFMEGGTIWNLVSKTGLTVFKAAWDTVTGEDSRAKGYNREDEPEKQEELITIAARVIRPQFIYKYITLNKEDIKEQRDTGALVRYVLSELPRRIVREVERAIVIGDGRADGSDFKITSFLSLKDDAETAAGFALQYTPASAEESKYESLLRARDLVKADGAKYLVTKTGYLTDILLMQSVNGGFVFAPGTDIARAMGFAGNVEPDWFDDTTDPENDAYIFVPSAYRTVGDNSIEAYTNFILKENKQEYLQEIYAGGALTKLKSAVAIAASAASS